MHCTFLLSTLTLSKLMKFFFYTAVLRLIFLFTKDVNLTYNLYQCFFFFLTVRDKWGLQMYWPSFLAWLVGSVSNTFLTSVFTVVQSAPWSSALDTKEIIYLTLGCSEFFILGIMCSMCCLDAKLHSTVLTRILENKWRNGWCTKPEKSLHLLVQSLTENSGTFIGV